MSTIKTYSILSFKECDGDLYIRPYQQSDRVLRVISCAHINKSDQEISNLFDWCEINSPLHIDNAVAGDLISYNAMNSKQAFAVLEAIKQTYKKPIIDNKPMINTSITPKYKMSFRHNGHDEVFYLPAPCYAVEINSDKRGDYSPIVFDQEISALYMLKAGNDGYVILKSCKVEQVPCYWSIQESHRDHDYELQYANGMRTWQMAFNYGDSDELVTWFINHQPEMSEEQLGILFSGDIESGFRIFKLMWSKYNG